MALWSRAPVYFPSMVVQLLPLKPQARSAIARGRLPQEVQFRVAPQHSKVEIKRYLESVYGLRVKSVNTANFEGKVKRRKYGPSKQPDWKKAFVSLEPGPYKAGG